MKVAYIRSEEKRRTKVACLDRAQSLPGCALGSTSTCVYGIDGVSILPRL